MKKLGLAILLALFVLFVGLTPAVGLELANGPPIAELVLVVEVEGLTPLVSVVDQHAILTQTHAHVINTVGEQGASGAGSVIPANANLTVDPELFDLEVVPARGDDQTIDVAGDR